MSIDLGCGLVVGNALHLDHKKTCVNEWDSCANRLVGWPNKAVSKPKAAMVAETHPSTI